MLPLIERKRFFLNFERQSFKSMASLWAKFILLLVQGSWDWEVRWDAQLCRRAPMRHSMSDIPNTIGWPVWSELGNVQWTNGITAESSLKTPTVWHRFTFKWKNLSTWWGCSIVASPAHSDSSVTRKRSTPEPQHRVPVKMEPIGSIKTIQNN